MAFKLFNDGENESIVFDNDGMIQAKDYWSYERIKNAIPIEISIPKPDGLIVDEDIVNSEVKNADINVSPYNAGGKLFFTQGGKNYVGSAEFCADKNLILTAAHCVRDMDTGDWSENIVFDWGYNSSRCKQVIPIRAVALKAYWYKDKDCRWDYAFGVTTEKCNIDVLNYESNVSSGDTTAFGYPVNYDCGKKMQTVSAKIDVNPYNSYTIRMKGNPMGGGCSGGAWVKQNTNIAVSLNSFSYVGDDSTVYGPKLTDDFISLVNYAKTLI